MHSTAGGAFTPLLVLSLLTVGAAPPSAAEDPEPYLVEYRAYNAALASGATEAAARHARAAWEAAEQSLGDHRLTAILAYNYGRLVVFSDAGQAHAALERASQLGEAGIADLAPGELRLYGDYARFEAGGLKRRDADRLRETLTAIGLDGADINPDLAPMWLRLASHDALEERFRKARESAAMAESAILKAAPDSIHARANAIAIGGIARLVPHPRKVTDVQAAHNEFSRARRLFGPQEDIDTFDPLLAKIMAWNTAAWSALGAMGKEDFPDHDDPDEAGAEPAPPTFRYQADPAIECGTVAWARRDAPNYPATPLRKGYIGAVLVGFRIGDDLAVHDARVLAEVPNATFGEAALRAVRQWRVAAPATGGPECNRNRLTFFRFIIEN